MSFQHGIAELVRAPIPRRIPTRKLWCVRSSPDSGRQHLSPKTLVATVEFQQHLPSPPQPHLPSSSTPAQSQQHVTTRAVMCGFEPKFWGAGFYQLHFLFNCQKQMATVVIMQNSSKKGRDWVALFRKGVYFNVQSKWPRGLFQRERAILRSFVVILGKFLEKRRPAWVDILSEVFCLALNWSDFRSQLVQILQILSALGRTFLQEIYTKKRTQQPFGVDAPLAQLQSCASQSSSVFPRYCQISTRIFNWKDRKDLIMVKKFTLIQKIYYILLFLSSQSIGMCNFINRD